MTILVTGAAGFLGRHIVRDLLARGEDVLEVDPAYSLKGDQPQSEKWIGRRIEDAASRDGSRRMISQAKIDAILHLGSPVGALGVTHYRGEVAYRICAAANAVGRIGIDHAAPVLNFSTSEIYGFGGHYAETDSAVVPARNSPRLAYAVGKLAAEQDLHSVPELRVTSVRLFNMAGPGQNARLGFVLPRWVDQVAAGEALTVFGSGLQTRCMMHVADLVEFVQVWLERAFGDQLGIGAVFNVGNPDNRTTMLDLARLVQAVTEIEWGETSPLETMLDGRVVYRSPDYEEAEGRSKMPILGKALGLGWKPTRSLRAIVEDVVRDHR